jgi:hypothetical protein
VSSPPSDQADPAPEGELPEEQIFALLHSASGSELLNLLAADDRLQLFDRGLRELRKRALLLDPARLQLRLLARVTYAARRFVPPFSRWIQAIMSKSIEELVQEDREDERAKHPLNAQDPRYAALSDMLGLDAADARLACVRFNALDHATRFTFFELVLEGKPMNRFIAEGNGPPKKVSADLARALRVLGLPPEILPAGDAHGA